MSVKPLLQTALLTASLAISIQAADPAMSVGMSNGRAWNGLGGGDEKTAVMLKFIYLTGLADGLHEASGDLYTELSSKPDKKAKKQADEIIPQLLGSMDFPAMINSVDEFYRDPENLDIPITFAARYIRSRTEGKSSPRQLQESLQRTRSYVRIMKQMDQLESAK
jgi:hypothetical protein